MKPSSLFLLVFGAASVASAVPGSTGPGSPSPGQQPRIAPATPSDPLELDRELARVERQHRDLEQQLRGLDERDALARQRSVAFGRAYVQASRAGLLPVAGGFDAFVEHATRIERLRRAARRELGERKTIARRKMELRRLLTDVASQLAVLRANKKAMAQAHSALLAARDRAAAFRRAFSSSAGHTAVYGSSAGPLDPTLSAQGFAAMKGSLPFPIAGRTEISRAERPGIEGPGLEIQAPVGTPVLAVFPGRVAFADEYGAYGKTVIIDHGRRYFTVSAGLDAIDVEVRDEIGAGSRVGSVGLGPLRPGLYFEVRFGAETVDPTDWLGL